MSLIQLRHSDAVSESMRVSTVYCVGLNYADHAAEMRSQRPEAPVIFLKPASSLLPGGGELAYPAHLSADMHHEVELVMLIGRDCYGSLTPEEAQAAVAGYGIGLDLTLRDRQAEAKAQGRPWSVAKGFAGSAPVSHFLPAGAVALPQPLSLHVNGELRQQGSTEQMIFDLPALVSYLASVFALRRGDLVFTGTPAGVGPLKPGDQVQARLGGLCALDLKIV
ncbi:MAG: fumarylacetoacetate hydrolase family protein [Candidatus Sericytochromatia bacterium]